MSDRPNDPPISLSPADAAAFDALRAAGNNLKLTGNAVDEARVKNLQAWLNILAAAPVPAPSANLLDRTLAAVQSDRMKLPAPSPQIDTAAARKPKTGGGGGENRPLFSRHLADVAAMLVASLILIAIIVPAVAHARESHRRVLCATNLTSVGLAFNQYSNDFQRQLPSLAVPADANWLNPGPAGHTNTANLMPLVNAHYMPPAKLLCAGRNLPPSSASTSDFSDIPACGYSYVNLFGRQRPNWDGKSATIILADRNPLFCTRGPISSESNSPNHQNHGNYVLRADNSVTWETSPDVGPAKDNIWTLTLNSQPLLRYTGTETPTSPNDTFLAP